MSNHRHTIKEDPFVFAGKINKVKKDLLSLEEMADEIKKRQSEIDDAFAQTLSQLRHLDYYDLSETDNLSFIDLQHRQSYLRESVQDAMENSLKSCLKQQESLQSQLQELRTAYRDFMEKQEEANKEKLKRT